MSIEGICSTLTVFCLLDGHLSSSVDSVGLQWSVC